MAMVASALKVGSLRVVRRRRDFLASAMRFLRTSHQGDSGAKQMPIRRGMGQSHWIANGICEVC
jgi:hypothetical protein